MLRSGNESQVYLHSEPVDMSKSINGLSILVEQVMDLSPLDSTNVTVLRQQDSTPTQSWRVAYLKYHR